MDNTGLPKHALNYKPRGRRDRGRPRKRWQCVDAGTGQTTYIFDAGIIIFLILTHPVYKI
jgi:predicted ArsR family transcriptional regulator